MQVNGIWRAPFEVPSADVKSVYVKDEQMGAVLYVSTMNNLNSFESGLLSAPPTFVMFDALEKCKKLRKLITRLNSEHDLRYWEGLEELDISYTALTKQMLDKIVTYPSLKRLSIRIPLQRKAAEDLCSRAFPALRTLRLRHPILSKHDDGNVDMICERLAHYLQLEGFITVRPVFRLHTMLAYIHVRWTSHLLIAR